MLELVINTSADEIDLALFTQADESLPEDEWQVAYDEHYLNTDGTEIVGDFIEKPKNSEQKTRIVFYMWFLDFNSDLITPFGNVRLTKPTVLPERLKRIIDLSEFIE